MNIFKSIFAMPKAVEAIISGGDKLIFTDEERKDWIIESAKVLGPQNIARRIISSIVTVLWMLLTIIAAGMILGEHEQIGAFADLYTKVSLVFSGIMAFYFGTHLARATNGKKWVMNKL